MTYLEIINMLKGASLQKPNVNWFVRDFYELNREDAEYSAIILQDTQHQRVDDFMSYSFYLGYADRLMADKSNEDEIYSNGINILNGLINGMRNALYPDVEISASQFLVVNQKFLAECAVVYADVTINVPISECEDYGDKLFDEFEKEIKQNGTYTFVPNGVAWDKISLTIDVDPEVVLQDKTVNITQNGEQEVTFDSGYDGLDTVTINTNVQPTLQVKSVSPSVSVQEITPDSSYDGLSKVNVGAVTSSIDSNIQASNIKQGVSILGVVGNLVKRNEYGNTGNVDVEGLTELGWNANDIAWLQKVCWWDAEDDDLWKVSVANKEFGPSGSTPITWDNMSSYAGNTDIVFFPKLECTVTNRQFSTRFPNLMAIPTNGWTIFNTGGNGSWLFYKNPQLKSVGNLSELQFYAGFGNSILCYASNIRYNDWLVFHPHPSQNYGSLRYWFGGDNTSGINGYSAFKKIDLTNLDMSRVTDDYSVFSRSQIEALKIDKWNYAGTDYEIFYSGCMTMKDLYVNEVTKSWNLSGAANLTRESCLRVFNALSTSVTGTITLHQYTKDKLSAEDIAIATNKGWTVS